ncbi:cytoplasmic dynein 2 intermediate chain 2 isoform X2 [Hippocampus comes]|uniref:cytoplasmic dynein 2 intermediate chain 2 isoform X2 n=1 Tax=Hippocampus comes TaxID=109280 RepID=UPI00094EFD78|nr:PREDICTED: WD repeat-containing protein 34 isoform X2 [Hippocampus comes]
MFTDEAQVSVSIQSSWRKSQQSSQESRGCQTRAIHSTETGVQTRSSVASSTQTELQDHVTTQFLQDPHNMLHLPGLNDFLRQIEAPVIRELVRNAKSHAFDGFQVNWEEHNQMVVCLHQLQHPRALEQDLHVTSVSWSCTGAVIACAYGRMAEGDWSNDKSYICTWNIDHGGLNPKQADLVIDVPTPVTALCCHPKHPALMTGGLYSGEVIIWDTSQSTDPVVAQTGMSADSHREPVCQVTWVPLQNKGDFGVLSACSGGRILLWTVSAEQGKCVLKVAFALVQQQVLSKSTSFKTPAAVPSECLSVPLRAPAVFSFRPGSGPVHSIHCSPFHRNLFLSAGTDGLAHLHSLLQTNPLRSIRVSDTYVFKVQWSPTRPLLFAAATGQGEVQIFDLSRRSLRPAATIDPGGVGHAATCLAFNCQNPGLLAVGKTDGTVGVWKLSTDLTEQIPTESHLLEQIANQVAE